MPRGPSDEILRLLVVDDDEGERATLRRHLAQAGVAANVDELADGGDVVAAAQHGGYDLLVLDLGRAGEDSLEMIAGLRKAGVSTPILAIGVRDEAVGAALVAAGASDFLPREELTPSRLAFRIEYVQRLSRAEHAATLARVEAENQRQLLRAVLHDLPTGVAVVDPIGRAVVLCNPNAETVLGDGARALIDDGDAPGAKAREIAALAALRGEHIAGDGTIEHEGRRYRVAATPIGGHDRVPVSLVVTLDDVTDEEVARESAERAAIARADTLAIVSHDLRGPLQSIRIALDALADEQVIGDERARYVAAVTRSVERADRLIGDLMTAAQIEAGTLRVEPTTVSTRALLEQARRDHEMVAGKSGIAIAVGEVDEATVQADRERVLQALGNLIQNALRHARGTPEITLSARRADDAIELSVRDRGPGIPADALPHLFDRYWQGRARRGSAGLGLAIVRGIARAHGGSARAAAAPGGGAEFTIRIPDARPTSAPGS